MSELVKVCSREESNRIIALLGVDRRSVGFSLKGQIDAVCRDAKTGEVAWEIHQPNIITDLGRRCFADYTFWAEYVFTSPSTDAAAVARYSLMDAGAASGSQTSASTNPTYDPVTLTKTYLVSFAVPPSNRTIGAIGLVRVAKTTTHGIHGILAYALISPAKTQGVLQTLEVSYRVTLTPVY